MEFDKKKEATTVSVYKVNPDLEATSSTSDINSLQQEKNNVAHRPWWKRKTFIIPGVTMVALIIGGIIAAAVVVSAQPKVNCPSVQIFVARGSFEPKGMGTSKKLADALTASIPNSVATPLDYPARMPYQGSMAVGSANLKADIARSTKQCPKTKIVLIGYSQGGAATMDAVCGGGDHPEIGPKTAGLTKEEGKNIKAITIFGEPRFVAGLPYTAGTDKDKSGLYARKREVALCPNFAPVIRSWCDNGDNRCASDGKDWTVHSTYLNRYLDDAVKFVSQKVK